MQDTVTPKENLVAQMRAISHEGYDRRVFIRADANANYGLVADIMARLSSSGFRNLGLVTDTEHGQQRVTPAQPQQPQRTP
jgi:biopolymer transport protein TolR